MTRTKRQPIRRRWTPPIPLTEEQRERLSDLLPAASRGGPAFTALLDCWEWCEARYEPAAVVPAYRTRGGTWLTAGVPQVVAAIRRLVA